MTTSATGLASAYGFVEKARRPVLEILLMLCPPAQREFEAGNVKTAFDLLKEANIHPKQFDKGDFLDVILAGLPFDYHY